MPDAPRVKLTGRQLVIVAVYSAGMTSVQTGALLGIAPSTVKSCVRLVARKFRAVGVSATGRFELEEALRATPRIWWIRSPRTLPPADLICHPVEHSPEPGSLLAS